MHWLDWFSSRSPPSGFATYTSGDVVVTVSILAHHRSNMTALLS